VPVGIYLRDAPDLSRLNAGDRLAIPGGIGVLQSDLEVLAGAFYRSQDLIALLDGQRQALLAVDMAATFKRRDDVLGMQGKRMTASMSLAASNSS